jgi:hypothetical protein
VPLLYYVFNLNRNVNSLYISIFICIIGILLIYIFVSILFDLNLVSFNVMRLEDQSVLETKHFGPDSGPNASISSNTPPLSDLPSNPTSNPSSDPTHSSPVVDAIKNSRGKLD